MLDFAAVSIVNDVFKIKRGVRRWTYRQNLISPHAKVTVCQETVLGPRQVMALASFIEHHKVVASPLHFCKPN
jgi:hypothetical protein